MKKKKLSKNLLDAIEHDNNHKIGTVQAERGDKGLFAKGNKIGTGGPLSNFGVRSRDIRRHRSAINERVDDLLQLLFKEAFDNNNTQVAMWLVGKVLPDSKPATFSNSKVINDIKSLTELKDQAAHTIKEGVEGESSLEETTAILSLYKDQKALIEAADIEPLAQLVKERMSNG